MGRYDIQPLEHYDWPKGCGLTSLSMSLNCAGVPNDPGVLNDFLNAHGGYYGTGVDWGPATKNAGGEGLKFHAIRSSSADDLAAALCQSKCGVIVGVNVSSKGVPCGLDKNGQQTQCHFVLVTGQQNGRFTIADPAGQSSFPDGPPYNSSFVTRGWVGDPAGEISELDLAVPDAELSITNQSGQQASTAPQTGGAPSAIPQSFAFVDSLADDVNW